MEADSLAQSVEMSAVPWPLLKLCFSVISNLWEIVLLSETAREHLSHGVGEIILNHKCQGLFTLPSRTIIQCCFCQWAAVTLMRDLQIENKRFICCLIFCSGISAVVRLHSPVTHYNKSNHHCGFFSMSFWRGLKPPLFPSCYINWF